MGLLPSRGRGPRSATRFRLHSAATDTDSREGLETLPATALTSNRGFGGGWLHGCCGSSRRSLENQQTLSLARSLRDEGRHAAGAGSVEDRLDKDARILTGTEEGWSAD